MLPFNLGLMDNLYSVCVCVCVCIYIYIVTLPKKPAYQRFNAR
jgi:hypothetical protein